MNSIPYAMVLSILFLMTSLSHGLAEPTLVWEVKGLQTPESVLPASDRSFVYVSNIGGSPLEKDGNGSISKVSIDGKMMEQKWVTGLNAPKGMALAGDRLFVADIDELVEIDTATGKIFKRYAAPGAEFLNDVTAGAGGTIFVSDTFANKIWRLVDGEFQVWLENDALDGPNGLVVQGSRLIVASFGTLAQNGKPAAPSSLTVVSLRDKSVKKLGNPKPVGHLDGLEPLEKGTYLVTDWNDGALLQIQSSGKAVRLLDLDPGSADLGFLPEKQLVIIPMMKNDAVAAYELN